MKTKIAFSLTLEHSENFPIWDLPDDVDFAEEVARFVGLLLTARHLSPVTATPAPQGGDDTGDPQEYLAPLYVTISKS